MAAIGDLVGDVGDLGLDRRLRSGAVNVKAGDPCTAVACGDLLLSRAPFRLVRAWSDRYPRKTPYAGESL